MKERKLKPVPIPHAVGFLLTSAATEAGVGVICKTAVIAPRPAVSTVRKHARIKIRAILTKF